MDAEERRGLLGDLVSLARTEAENFGDDVTKWFLPLPVHRLALRPETVIVRGGRGAGKSALFRLLGPGFDVARIRRFFHDDQIPDARWFDAFSQSTDRHPEVGILDSFGRSATPEQIRSFWMGHLLLRLEDEGLVMVQPGPLDAARGARNDVGAWVASVAGHLGALANELDTTERRLAAEGLTAFATYDHLDRIGAWDPTIRRRFVGGLLSLWLSLSNRYRWLRAKIFLRDDLLDAGELAFADASKLRARSVSIEWEVEHLYRVCVRQMAALSPGLAEWVRGTAGQFSMSEDPNFGWMPGPMPETVQRAFAKRLAGEAMGSGTNKGYTYRWIPNHLQDAQRRLVPRSFLNLVGFAAESALKKPLIRGNRLFIPKDLVAGLTKTSHARSSEIKEEYGLVMRLENLRGLSVMLDPKIAVARLGQAVPEEQEGLSTNGEAVLEELIRLGVVSRRSDGRIDVPDIYRSGFGILRKGGVARPK